MSLVPYISDSTEQQMDYVPFVTMGAFIVAAMLLAPTENEAVEETPVVELTPEVKPKKKSYQEDPLDSIIMGVLRNSSKPMTVKEIVKAMKEVTKSEVNSRLYTMLHYKKINQTKTEGAPLWQL